MSVKETKWYFCAAEGCSSDDRKRGKYGYMKNIEFFPFPTKKNEPKLRKQWLQLLRRDDYLPTKKHRVCSLHFVDGRPTKEHPLPELFSYNNYKKNESRQSSVSLLRKRESCSTSKIGTEIMPMDFEAKGKLYNKNNTTRILIWKLYSLGFKISL